MKSLVIGMGIGQLYVHVLQSLGATVKTVDTDPAKMPDYLSLSDALRGEWYDTVHVCTPNWTHESIARTVAPHARIVFVEKPGLKTEEDWLRMVTETPTTRFMMVKNNQYRDNIDDLVSWARQSDHVTLRWCNRNRVPNAGTWFTDRNTAWGGVSRDLMPHLLSLALKFAGGEPALSAHSSRQRWQLSDLTDTEYGTIKKDGVYNVDDVCEMLLTHGGVTYDLRADWRTETSDDRCVEFWRKGDRLHRFELGLCPEDAYAKMIDTAFRNLYNQEYWFSQLKQDTWIHRQMELLSQ